MIRILKPGMFATSMRSRNLWPSAPRVLLPAAACPWRVLLWKLDQSCLGGREEWSHWIPLAIIGFPDVNLSRVLYRHSFFAGANGSSVLIHTVSICLSHTVFDFWKALK